MKMRLNLFKVSILEHFNAAVLVLVAFTINNKTVDNLATMPRLLVPG